ncbi:MAG: hypothetical protein FJZ95_10210, partial [Chloroflexi bacterium]|nr:hypothetical protein [Chloroflexota bacterium]
EAGSEDVLFNGLSKILIEKRKVDPKRVPAEVMERLSEYTMPGVSSATGIAARDLERLVEALGKARNGIIIYGEELLKRGDPVFVNSLLVTALMTLSELLKKTADTRSRVMSLKPSGNSLGAWGLGMASGDIPWDKVKAAYVLLGEDEGDEDVLGCLQQIGFVIVQASRPSPMMSIADVVLPSPIWAERAGEYVNMDGRRSKSGQSLLPRGDLLQDSETLVRFAKKLGHDLSTG